MYFGGGFLGNCPSRKNGAVDVKCSFAFNFCYPLKNSLSLIEVIKMMDEITKDDTPKFDLQLWWHEHKEKILRSIIHD